MGTSNNKFFWKRLLYIGAVLLVIGYLTYLLALYFQLQRSRSCVYSCSNRVTWQHSMQFAGLLVVYFGGLSVIAGCVSYLITASQKKEVDNKKNTKEE